MPLAWPDPQPDPAKANTKEADIRSVLLQEYGDRGQWARHYSAVRMTLGTFFITAATGIITLRWDTPQLAIAIIAAIVFGVGVALFWIFTSYTFEHMNAQFDIIDSYRGKLMTGHVPLKRVKLFSVTGLPIAILLAVAFLLFDGWWLWKSKAAPRTTTQVIVPMKVKVGQQPEETMNVPVSITPP